MAIVHAVRALPATTAGIAIAEVRAEFVINRKSNQKKNLTPHHSAGLSRKRKRDVKGRLRVMGIVGNINRCVGCCVGVLCGND